jgi:hypothetical protein
MNVCMKSGQGGITYINPCTKALVPAQCHAIDRLSLGLGLGLGLALGAGSDTIISLLSAINLPVLLLLPGTSELSVCLAD